MVPNIGQPMWPAIHFGSHQTINNKAESQSTWDPHTGSRELMLIKLSSSIYTCSNTHATTYSYMLTVNEKCKMFNDEIKFSKTDLEKI